MEFLLPHRGEEREQIISEIDKIVLYHYKLKILYEEKLRRRFGRVHGNSAADAEDTAIQDLLDSVSNGLNFGELASGDAVDLAAQEADEDLSSEDYSTSEDSNDESDSQTSTQGKAASKSLPISPMSLQSGQASQKRSSLSTQRGPSPVQSDFTVSAPEPTFQHQRSLSLRSARSLTSLNGRSRDTPPPVPPLPVSVKSNNFFYSKALPSKPLPRRPVSQPSQKQASKGAVLPQHRQPKPGLKNIQQSLTPPELVLIPQLLPVFVEMVGVGIGFEQ